jgi:hypothetical protein
VTCTGDSDCPPAMACVTGRCKPSGTTACSIDADCTAPQTCKPRGFPAVTGLCR